MPKNLVYYVIGGGNKDYIKLLELCVKSVLRFRPHCDFLVICDADWEPVLSNVKQLLSSAGYPLLVHLCEHNDDHVCASMRKIEAFDWAPTANYDAVMYMDCDIVVTRDPTFLFERIAASNKLCVCSEHQDHNGPFYSLEDYTDQELAFLNENAITPFNCGQFGFSPLNFDIRSQFAELRSFIATYKTTGKPYFYEQGFMNKHFNLRNLTDNGAVFDDATVLFAATHVPDKTIHHACNASLSCEDKHATLQSIYDSYMVSLDTRMRLHTLVRPGSVCRLAEIGVFNGGFAKYLASFATELHLIDPWLGDIMSGDQDGNDVQTYKGEELCNNVYEMFKGDDRVTIHRGFSGDVMETFPDAHFDMIYIDGDHSYQGVSRDLEVSWKKIKNFGWVIGHDYEMNYDKARNSYDFGVKQAVAEFCEKYGQKVSLLARDGCVSFGILVVKG